MANLDRLLDKNYLPTLEDALRVSTHTIGCVQHSLRIDGITYEIVDVGGIRAERKKWIHVFPNTDIVLFLVALDKYDNGTQYSDTVSNLNLYPSSADPRHSPSITFQRVSCCSKAWQHLGGLLMPISFF